jgi:hypothetical protein
MERGFEGLGAEARAKISMGRGTNRGSRSGIQRTLWEGSVVL